MPDAGGKVGSITVTNKGGTQTLSRSGQATEVKDAGAAPTSPSVMDKGEIASVFGAALAAQKEFPVWLVFFKTDTTSLTKDSYGTLKEIAAEIKQRKSTDISITGHTDRLGTREANFALSVERALKIRDILVSQGIDPRFIETNGVGEEVPLVKTRDEVPEPQNRRAEVKVR